MLDLTDPKNLKEMGIDQKGLTQKIDDANEAQKVSIYAYTNNIANQAYAKGYMGIIYNSSRNTDSSNNRAVVLFGAGRNTIQDHLVKADFVPVDFRVLLPENQIVFLAYVKTFPKAQ
ncbi:hypothetical protein [Acinetobacter sp. 1000160]|uniref:hypothetical protein n=1 Tax=Acinetobacter sp. 1000160 TaxID=1310800 RepID=UPI00044BC8C9|nr:hypothetical protein [Acinetobacter sp. 1000160]EXB48754.1 hypothetical protein J522_0331 [Acinetobacter baumannii 146457]EYT22761.1 hypothetical protein J699_01104 [Acinetobacter sp. 1000160]